MKLLLDENLSRRIVPDLQIAFPGSTHVTLDGDLGDPQFSLNESLARRLGASVASTLGISIEGLAHGVGSAAQGVGSVVKKLFGK